ncbi:hypothetical protein M9H77_06996 [Catharanthus roseus]|uniref:Uncharacterized protein n=1 Tax=Catharanthus roseus TaxID=4058 RepID=A0ACC0BTX9_CATRO|nr:hypothetical protein M9H77_06996 [Catharanthus roseus]
MNSYLRGEVGTKARIQSVPSLSVFALISKKGEHRVLVVIWLVVTCGVEVDGHMDGPLPNDMLGRFTLDLDPADRGRSTVRGPKAGSTRRLCRYPKARYLFVFKWRVRFRTLSIKPIMYMHGFEKWSVAAAPMCLDSLKLSDNARTLQKV